jgi:hypothetical protein
MKRKRTVRRLPTRKPRNSQESENAAAVAAREYSEHNKDIALAVETMRQAQLIQETRVKYLLDNLSYQVIGV